ncbi:MAG TPA: hypothetical protein GXZ20_06250 [Halanaerobiaceae bacterium]|nr:hypothetical protein [Halanaerobiaceae bacterium]
MKRKIFILIFLLALISSLGALYGRYRVENAVQGVELILDYDALSQLEVDKAEYLKELKDKGLTAIALYPVRLMDLLNSKEAKLITGTELIRYSLITGELNPLLADFPFTEESAFLIADNKYQSGLGKIASKYELEYRLAGEEVILFFPEWKNEFLHLSPGFDQEALALIREKGLKPVPRFYNNELINDYYQELMVEMAPELIIFAGADLTGYQNKGNKGLEKTAQVMRANKICFGMIEPFIARQKGAVSLAYLLDFNILRVHSIQQEEMDERENYTVDKIIERYMRAVRERNVRLLYLKPFLRDKDGQTAAGRTLAYIDNLAEKLEEAGYKPGSPASYDKYISPGFLLILTGMGIIAGGVLLLNYLLPEKYASYNYLLLVLGLLVELALLFLGRGIFLRKVLALGSAVVFPSLAIISQLMDNGHGHYIFRFIKACLISLVGALFLAASLAHISFMLYVDLFTGVKLSFILPLVFISVYFLQGYIKGSGQTFSTTIKAFLEKEIKVKHLLLLALLALAGLIYIGRTGNYFIIPVSRLEVFFRDLLEKTLYIRPRFKEFLIGHPFLLLALGLRKRFKDSLYFYPLIILATIGQINILNTFSHAHTPLLVSFLRSFHGIWLGGLLGFILLGIVNYIMLKLDRYRGDYPG